MRSWIGLPWVVVAALGWTVAGCGSSDSDSGSNRTPTEQKDPWLEGDPDDVFANASEGADKSLGQGGAGGGAGPGGAGPGGGAAGTGSQMGDPLATLCPGYAASGHGHTITAAAADPGNMAAATRARELLGRGETPVPGFVRGADFANYFGWTLPSDIPEGQLGGKVEMRPRKIDGQEIATQFDVYVGVVAGKLPPTQVVLTVVVDSSLTVEGLARAKATVEGLGKGLKPGDHVTLMSADPSWPTLEKDLTADFTNELAALANQITLGTGSVAARLPAAYQKAKLAPAGTWNRVVVIGDGEEDDSAVDYAGLELEAANSQIFLSAFGVSGANGFGDAALYRMARSGRGRYVYFDAVSEPSALFTTRFDEVFGLARDKVRIRVDLPSYMHSLDPEPVGSGSPRDKYLAPGEWAHFLFHVAVCNKDAIHDGVVGPEPFAVTVTSTLADGQTEAPPFTLKSQPVKKYLAIIDNPMLDRMAAIQSFVDALKYPEKTRFEEAKTRLAALTASPGPELLGLLGKHPSFPQ